MQSDDPNSEPDDSGNIWITAVETRRICGNIAPVTLFRWCRNPAMGFPRAARIQNKMYFKKAEVLAWMESQLQGAA